MKDIKSILKEAREAIKNKNYEQSLKLCKQVLREDKENYTALVFFGVSFQETGQSQKALNAFKNAIQVNSSNPLAWSGLANYYEKLDNQETKIELVNVYISLLKIETNEKKLLEYSQKLSDLQQFGNLSEIVHSIYFLLKSEKCLNNIDLWSLLADLLSRNKNLPTEIVSIHEEALLILINNRKTVRIEYYGEYLSLLYKQGRLEELFFNAKKMNSLFETDSISLRWICKIFNEIYVEQNKLIESKEAMLTFSEALLKLESQSPTAFFTKSILLFDEDKFVEARDLLSKVVNLLPGLLHAWVLQLKCCMKLFLLPEAIQASAKINKLFKSDKKTLKNEIDLLMLEVLSKSNEVANLNKALEIVQTVDEKIHANCRPHIIRINIKLKKFEEAEKLISDIKNDTDLFVTYKLLSAQLLHAQEKYSEALTFLNEEVELSEWWLEIGTLYWDAGERDKSLIPFLKAAKLEPSNYSCFLLLGNYYKEFNDLDKARRCYEKAFKSNSRCAEAGIELSKIYRNLKNWDANSRLLQSLTTGVINKQNSWAWMQLGLNYMEQNDYDKAITNLRYVIRIDENNMHCWESLADAYLAKGAYTSALKCYEKASELSKHSLYPSLQTANIKLILGEYTEARANFEEILSSNENYVPALKGIAETCLCQAKDCYRSQRYGTSRGHTQYAADKLIKAIHQRSDLVCLWKLLADSCLFVTKLPEKYSCLLLLASFVEGKDIQGNQILEKEDLFVLSARCYCKALNLMEDNVLIWHDLANCYLRHALNSEDSKTSEELLTRARTVAQYCTSINPTYWQHWNLLANVLINSHPLDYQFVQHCLIKAAIADNNSAVAWCNLGTLYLILSDIKLANEAFSQAQRSDPNYVNSWIGQGIIAENCDHEDAMDLFRHSTQLGMHQQGALGYAHWVCKTLKESPLDTDIYSIHNMHAIPVACDFLTWYTENNPYDSSAWNMLGILRERTGLKCGALKAFQNALNLSPKSRKDQARINCGRLLAKLGRYSDAIEAFSSVEAATFNSASGLALALFKDKHFKESYEAYESALHWLTEEQSFQSDLLVALASMAYMFEGPDAAKTLLFQSIQLENPSPWGFYATLSLGLLHKDFNLSGLVHTELQSIKDRTECIQHYSLLAAHFYLLQNKNKSAIREVSKMIHKHPDQASLWLILSSLFIRLQTKGISFKSVARCAQAAMKLGQSNIDVTKVLCLVSLSSHLANDERNALITAQKAVHCYPDIAEGWSVLITSILNSKKLDKSCVKAILKHVEVLSNSDVLTEWMQNTIHLL